MCAPMLEGINGKDHEVTVGTDLKAWKQEEETIDSVRWFYM